MPVCSRPRMPKATAASAPFPAKYSFTTPITVLGFTKDDVARIRAVSPSLVVETTRGLEEALARRGF